MSTSQAFEKLIEILKTLRGPGGCPWDQEQTHKDINPYLLEEAHEVVESIDREDFPNLKEELGDLLVHILFHCELASEKNHFNAMQVADGATEKLIRRHPHVFGNEKAETVNDVLVNWEKIKQKEGKEKKRDSILDGLPKALPALVKSLRISEKASRVGFDWPSQDGVVEKIEEELGELKSAMDKKDSLETESELGDLLFAICNLGRFLKIDPETALRKSTERFSHRFQWMEKAAKEKNKSLQSLTLHEWEDFWNRAKIACANS